ncbi:MAG: hypothetical protein C0483_13435 [Pirellula sp.]|nr:hypothetical protein [Pirellula sp.]
MRCFALLVGLTLLFTTGCGSSSKAVDSASAAPSAACEVRLLKDGQVVLEYRTNGAGNAAVQIDDDMSLFLNSPDADHSLVLNVNRPQVGTFPFGDDTVPGNASLTLVSVSQSNVRPEAGEVKFTQLTSTRCSGNFQTSAKVPFDEHAYVLEGSFTNFPVHKQ